MNASEQAYVESLENENTQLKEQLEWYRRQIFGEKSEKYIPSSTDQQLYLEGMGDLKPVEEKNTVLTHQRKKAKVPGADRVILPADLPVEKVILDIPEEDKVCKKTGKKLVKFGEEISSKIAHKPGSFYIKQYIRPKYALPDGEGVACSELPDSLLHRCLADESFLAELIVNKYGDHLPHYRTEDILKRQGIQISRKLLSQWTVKSAYALEPLYNALKKSIKKEECIFVDESPVKMLAPGKGKTANCYVWVLATRSLCYYEFKENRSHIHAEDLLKEYKGVYHSDKYGAYEKLAKDKNLIWMPCWAHVRRKFFEVESGDLDFKDWMLEKIQALYLVEQELEEKPPDEWLTIRHKKGEPLIDEMIKRCREKLYEGKVLPKSKLRVAIGYFCGLIPYLKNYFKHVDAKLDNNTAERAIRPLAIGRKNWLFVGSDRGGHGAAILFSLVQTCRRLEINPREYLEDVMRRIMSYPANRIEDLLPQNWKESQPS